MYPKCMGDLLEWCLLKLQNDKTSGNFIVSAILKSQSSFMIIINFYVCPLLIKGQLKMTF